MGDGERLSFCKTKLADMPSASPAVMVDESKTCDGNIKN
jgi:hypothetical protein